MVSKLELNNCIIYLRKYVKRAKIRTISKLTRKVKGFKQAKEKNPENAKLDVKIKKLLEEMEAMKKIDKALNVKKIFTFSGNLKGVIANPKADPLDKAVARIIFSNDFLEESIKKTKERFNLKDDDEEWKNDLLTMGKIKTKKLKKEGLKVEGGKKVKKFKKKASGAEGETKLSKNAKMKKKAVKEEAMETSPVVEKSPKKEKPMKNTSGDSGDEKPKSPKKQKKQDKSDKVMQMSNKSKKIPPKAKNLLNKKKGKDFKKNMNGNVKSEFAGKGPQKKPFQKGPPKSFQYSPGKDKATKDHPSWEAKKKQKPAIKKFQGKKTKFSE